MHPCPPFCQTVPFLQAVGTDPEYEVQAENYFMCAGQKQSLGPNCPCQCYAIYVSSMPFSSFVPHLFIFFP